MLSERKKTLLFLVCAAIFGAALCCLLAVLSITGALKPEITKYFFVPLLAASILVFLSACLLFSEYSQALRGEDFNLLTEQSLSSKEFSGFLQWCPPRVTLLSFVVAACGFTTALILGFPTGSNSGPFTATETTQIMVFQSTFYFLSIPFIVSALRVPRSFRLQIFRDREVPNAL